MLITLSLRFPSQAMPMQTWTFENQPVISIGRAIDNHLVLRSAVVSRYHVELRHIANRWIIKNLGNNGTFINGEAITHVQLEDGMILSLAYSGPQIQVRLGESAEEPMLRIHPAPRKNSVLECPTLTGVE
ncbi:MAG: FHA domain-containing protein [Cyanothece sp. SIO1E1]|nr:FHA domain-containing protein [Cyanothece sp. SIO1E1]